MSAGGAELIARLEAEARARFVRWDPALWAQVVAGPAELLAAGLSAAQRPGEDARGLVESYLRLASHLFAREGTGAETFLSKAWLELIPRALPAVAAHRRAEVLAQCWNLGENLLQRPPFLDVIFQRVAVDSGAVSDLPALVSEVERQVFQPPDEAPLTAGATSAVWIDTRAEDPHFLPGACRLVAPTVACVYDRLRTGGGGRPPVALGVWLRPEPLLLGPMRGLDETAAEPAGDPGFDGLWAPHARADRRLSAPYHEVRNRWRALCSLWTSQQLVALLPA